MSATPATLLPMPFDRTLIIIPTFNEATNIRQLLDALIRLYEGIRVLVVDDGSPDGTAAIVEEMGKEHPNVRCLKRQGKGGRGSAVLAGFTVALQEGCFDTVFEMDADFSHDPREIAHFLERIKQYDVVSGSRYLPGSRIEHWGWKRTFFSRCANVFARLVLGIPITDYTNGYRCYRIGAIKALDLDRIDAKGYVVLSEVAYELYKKGFRIGEVPTIFVNRRRGISNLSLHEIREAFLSVLRIRRKRVKTACSC